MSCTRLYSIIILLVAGAVALSVASRLPASPHATLQGMPCALEAQKLLELLANIENQVKPSADDVFLAYKEYVHLYKLQVDSAAQYNAGKAGGGQVSAEERYECISKVLQTPLLDPTVETLFSVFNPDSSIEGAQLNKKLRAKLERAINQFLS